MSNSGHCSPAAATTIWWPRIVACRLTFRPLSAIFVGGAGPRQMLRCTFKSVKPAWSRYRGVSTQNSWPSGSALITVDGWSEVEMQPVLPGLRHQWRHFEIPGGFTVSP